VSHSAKMAEDKSEKMLISFMCQRCSQPLQLDDSLSSFSEHISAELNCNNEIVTTRRKLILRAFSTDTFQSRRRFRISSN
jgi:hypothetical protein